MRMFGFSAARSLVAAVSVHQPFPLGTTASAKRRSLQDGCVAFPFLLLCHNLFFHNRISEWNKNIQKRAWEQR